MKIDITGSVASGKTTLASRLSAQYNISYYQKDNIVWKRTDNGDLKRSDKERDEIFMDILASDNWIVEGSPRKCLNESFEVCDYIILLDISTLERLKRVIVRWLRQKAGKEKYNTKPTMVFLYYNIKWVFEFNRDRKDYIRTLSEYGEKFRRFKNQEDALIFINSTY